MSKAASAKQYSYGDGRPMLVEAKYEPKSSSVDALIAKIRDSLSLGCAVLVRGWQPNNPPLEFTVDDIHLYRPTLSQEVIVQGEIDSMYVLMDGRTDGYRCIQTCQGSGSRR